MIDKVLEALDKELLKLFVNDSPMIIRDTQFKVDNIPLGTAPLIILSIVNTPDVSIGIGGAKREDVDFDFRVYLLDVNANLDDDSGYSTGIYALIDTIIKHFASQQWLTDEYKAIVKDYNFCMTLNGLNKAERIQTDNGGVLVGYVINYNSTGLDLDTTYIKENTYTAPPIININLDV
jgi:hypothetical protein